MNYFKKQWVNFTRKTLLGKLSDIVFVLFIIAMLVPSTRKQISAFAAGMMATSPKVIDEKLQAKLSPDAYAWQLRDADGQAVQFSEFNGRPVFVNFWATWCPPCIAEMPSIQKLYDQFGDSVAFVLVTDEDPQLVTAFMKKKAYTFPVYQNLSAVPVQFASSGIPVTFVVSPSGNILIRKTGAAKWSSTKMVKLMDELIASQP